MRYVTQTLNSQEIQTLLAASSFQTLAPTSGNPTGPRASYIADLPARSGPSGEAISVYIQQAQVAATPTPLNAFYIGVSGCRTGADCSAVRARAAGNAQQSASQRMPLDGMGVSAVLYGDSNRDGLTDLLVRFSDGTGTLYRAVPPQPAATSSPATSASASHSFGWDLFESVFYLYLLGDAIDGMFSDNAD
ncbi:MAG: hypothetical protein K8R69_05065 [Deltaproteobacteria bacterium]|nr:hypothetical protein [Deltaproteobacteria bacterium]